MSTVFDNGYAKIVMDDEPCQEFVIELEAFGADEPASGKIVETPRHAAIPPSLWGKKALVVGFRTNYEVEAGFS
jgi:hypothetical protein